MTQAPLSTGPRDGDRLVQLAGGSALNLLGTVVRQVSIFGITLVLARWLGASAVGEYSQAYAIHALVVLASLVGMRIAMTHFVATFRADGDFGAVKGVVRIGLGVSGFMSVALAIVVFVSADLVATEYLADPDIAPLIRLSAIAIPFATLMTTALAATQGFKTMGPLAGVGMITEPSARLVLTTAVLLGGLGLEAAFGAFVATSCLGAFLSLLFIHRFLHRMPVRKPKYPFRVVANYAGFSWISSLATQGILWADILIVGFFVASDDVGIYGVSTRAILLAATAITPLTAAMAPQVADAWRRGDISGLSGIIRTLTGWTWRISLPLVAIVALYPAEILRIFGDEFVAGRLVVLILVPGVLAEAFGAPASVLLNQTRRTRLNMVLSVAALVFNVLANVILVPRFGIEGAAVAWTLTLVPFGIIRLVVVRKQVTGAYPWGVEHGKAVLAVLVASALASIIRLATSLPWQVQLVLASFTLITTYLLLIYLLGGTATDRRVWTNAYAASRSLLAPLTRKAEVVRARRSLAQMPTSTDSINVASLISPFRYDVLVRAEFFRLARQNRDLIATDPDRFIQMVRQSRYFLWFEKVAVPNSGREGLTGGALERVFKNRVVRSLRLLESYEQHGGLDEHYPITVRELAEQDLASFKGGTVGGKMLVDGGHRLALAFLDGQTILTPSEYRLADRGAPLLNNTTILKDLFDLDDDDVYGFIAWGHGLPTARSREELLARAASVSPAIEAQIAAFLETLASDIEGVSRS